MTLCIKVSLAGCSNIPVGDKDNSLYIKVGFVVDRMIHMIDNIKCKYKN